MVVDQFKKKDMKNNQALIGILGGVAVGTVLGILLAPEEGSKTRKKIIKKSTDAADDLKEKLSSILNFFSGNHNSLVNNGKESNEGGLNDAQIRNIMSINKVLGK